MLAGGPRPLRIASYLIAELSCDMELATDGAVIEARSDIIHFTLLFNMACDGLSCIISHFIKTHFIQLFSFLQIRFPLDDLVNFGFGACCHFSFCEFNACLKRTSIVLGVPSSIGRKCCSHENG